MFTEAKNAYRARKAELQAERNAKIAEKEAQRARAMQALAIDDSRSVGTRRSGRSRHHSVKPHHRSRYEQDLEEDADGDYRFHRGLPRRRTDMEIAVKEPRHMANRSKDDSNIDKDLAYGECNAVGLPIPPPDNDESQLNSLIDKAKMLLEEADCLQHSATATITHLQKYPDAMAAVALTLAEISNLVAKMAPGVLTALKANAPGIFALLASPQFLIAAGVGVGVTIVMFGGYKIIRQLTGAKPENDNTKAIEGPADNVEQMIELNPEHLNRVENWRRGVTLEAQDDSKVDGEFITRTAARMSGLDISTEAMARDPRFKKHRDDESMASSHRSRRSRYSSKPHSSQPRAKSRARSETRATIPSKGESKPREFLANFKSGSKAPKAESKAGSKPFEKDEKKAKDKPKDKSKEKDKSKDKDKDKDKDKTKRPSKLKLMLSLDSS